MLKVGLIGCGGIGAVHAECWLMNSDVAKLVAVADVDEEKTGKYAERSGAKVYKDGFELLANEELDVVDICLPTFLHARYLVKAMETVPNVIVEKPICLHEEEAQQILEAQEKTGALVQVGHVVRFAEAYRYLKETVDSGKYGSVVAADFSRISPRPMWMKGHDDRDRTGTMVVDMHIHDVDYIRYLMGGEPDEISTNAVKDADGIPQHIWTCYRYGNAVLTAEGSWNYPVNMPFAQTFRVRLENAALILDEKSVLNVYPEDGEPYVADLATDERDLGINVSDMQLYTNEFNYFIDTILTQKRDGIASLSEAVASFRLAVKEMEAIS